MEIANLSHRLPTSPFFFTLSLHDSIELPPLLFEVMLLVNVIIMMLIRMGEASLITVTRTNRPDASKTSPPPLYGRGQQGKIDETVTIRGPGTCGFLSMKFHFLIETKEIHGGLT